MIGQIKKGKPHNRYPNELKHKIAKEYLSGAASYAVLAEEHGQKGNNLTKALRLERAGQLWVSDITYIWVGGGFCYLILITDAYSHQVVGHNFWHSMDAAFCVEALKMGDACWPSPQFQRGCIDGPILKGTVKLPIIPPPG